MDVTIKDNTNNQASYDYLFKRLLLGKYTTRRIDYANISGAEETVEIGTVMGRVDATKKLVPCQSDADDGSQEPVCILMEKLDAIATAGTVDQVLVCDGGEINKDLLVFQNGTDTLETSVTATSSAVKTMEDFLKQNGNGFEFLAVNDASEYDN
jgi:hypothetical protein